MKMTTASGLELHPIGIGTWGIASRIDETVHDSRYQHVVASTGNETAETDAISYSLSLGQNHIDCAELYGAFYTDEVVGRVVGQLSVEERRGIFVADKLWKNSVGSDAVRPTVESMLAKLGTDYLDLLYIHASWPDTDWAPAVSQIDDLIDEGLVRHFGVSNFALPQLRQAMSLTRHRVAANQLNFNCLYRDEVPDDLRMLCNENSIEMVAYQPVKRGEVLENATLGEIAASHRVGPAAVAIAWLIAQGALTIPKAVKREHIDENITALGIELSDDEILAIAAL